MKRVAVSEKECSFVLDEYMSSATSRSTEPSARAFKWGAQLW